MKYSFIKFLLILFWAVLLVQCQKERDEYYEIPDWSGKSIYETLQDKGTFGKYLQLADKTRYAVSLKGNGLWSVFAPNDVAVDAWLTEKGYASVDAVPVSVANKVVAYSMLFNKYRLEQLHHVLNNGWDSLHSVKKRTLYYETIHKELYGRDGKDSVWVVSPTVTNMYSTNENNYKYIPYYLDAYFVQSAGLSANDYTMLYPSSKYTGKNVQRASVLEQDIVAGNGFIHEIDRVNEPLPNFEDILKDEDYSIFRSLIESKNPLGQPYFYSYATNPAIDNYFKKMYPSQNIDGVNIKFYSSSPVPLNCERYVLPGSSSTEEGELGGYTLFVPNNEGVQKFYEERLAEYYGEYPTGMANVPLEIWLYFFQAQMADRMVYPQQFRVTANFAGDYLNGEGISGPEFNPSVYSDIRPASNGLFYGGNDYIKSSMFETVFSEILLRSKYSMMLNAMAFYFGSTLSNDLMKSQLTGDPNWDYTVLLLSDEQLQKEAESSDDGFKWEPVNNAYGFTHSFGNTDFANTRMQRLIRSHVFKRLKSNKLDFNAGNPAYGGYGYAVNDFGDMIRFKDGKIQMLGNYDKVGDTPEDNWITVTPITSRSFNNGTVYTVDKPLQYSICTDDAIGSCNERPMVEYLQEAADRNPNVSKSVEYLIALLNGNIITLSADAFYTILLPDNTSINNAVAANVIPAFDAADQVALTGALSFFQYHIIPGTLFVDDGYEQLQMPTGNIEYSQNVATLYKLPLSSTYLTVKKQAGRLFFETYRNPAMRLAYVAQGESRSNQFGAKSVIHEIGNYFVAPVE